MRTDTDPNDRVWQECCPVFGKSCQRMRQALFGLTSGPTGSRWVYVCRPAPLEVSIDFVQPLYQAILDRAVAQGVPAHQPDPVLTSDPGLYLLTDRGTVLENRSVNPGVAKFALPSGVHSVRLVSRNARPSDTIGPFVDDRRCLGVLVGAVTLFASQTAVDITTHLEQDLPGWHASEHGPVRWTNGFAFLPLPENSVTHGSSLAIEVRAVTVYRLEEDEPAALSA